MWESRIFRRHSDSLFGFGYYGKMLLNLALLVGCREKIVDRIARKQGGHARNSVIRLCVLRSALRCQMDKKME